MADNVTITAGSGTTIAADDISGVYHQRVKLSLGADGVAADAPGNGTDGLLVNLGANNDVTIGASLPAGANLIGGTFTGNGFVSSDNVYSAVIVASAAGASKNHLSIYNADASLKVDILTVYVTKETTAAVTGLIRGHRLFRFTTAHTGGTTPTVRRLDTGMSALDADVTVRAASTIGGAEAEPLAAVGVGEEETATTGGRLILFDHRETNRPITLNQNEGVSVQQDATAGTGLVSVGILFRVR